MKQHENRPMLDASVIKLNTDKFHAVTVLNCDGFPVQKIEVDATGDKLKEKYGSVEDFIESIHAKGIVKIAVQDKRSNGSTYRKLGEYEFSFPTAESVPEQNYASPISPAVQPKRFDQVQPQMSNDIFGLMGSFGMSVPDVMYKIQDHNRILTELSELKAEHKHLKSLYEKVKDENKEHELLGTKAVEKANATNDTLKTIGETIQPLIGIIATKMMGSNVPGLGQPEGNLSPVRQHFITVGQTADESLLSDLLTIAHLVSNPIFDDELTTLIDKFNLTPNDNATN